jgi:hypothetical protein
LNIQVWGSAVTLARGRLLGAAVQGNTQSYMLVTISAGQCGRRHAKHGHGS